MESNIAQVSRGARANLGYSSLQRFRTTRQSAWTRPTIRSPSMNRNSRFRPVGASPTVMGLSSVNIGFSCPPRAGPVPDGPDSSPAHIEARLYAKSTKSNGCPRSGESPHVAGARRFLTVHSYPRHFRTRGCPYRLFSIVIAHGTQKCVKSSEGSGGRADRPAAFQEFPHGLCLLGVQRRGPAAAPALGRGAVHAGLGPAPDGVPLPLGQGQEHVRHWLGGWNETRLS